LANAAVSLGVDLRTLLLDSGVDACTFGGTKNGLVFGEAIVFPRSHPAALVLPFIRKQGMQLASKMRFVSAQFEALLRDDLWRRNAAQANRMAQRTTILATDKASGIKSRVLARTGAGETDDLTLLDRVESEVFRDPAIPKGDINVMVVDGKAVLRGQVAEPQIGAIETAVRKVVGVKDVENLLHVPGTPAPNKARSRAVTGNGGTSPL
jgi:hypothetical protein